MPDFNLDLAKQLISSQEQFPINFEDAYIWLDYHDKSTAKRAFLNCGFVEGVDFNSSTTAEVRVEGSRQVTRNVEKL